MAAETHAQFNDIVLVGARLDKGMASFRDILTPQQVEAVHAYLIARAKEDWADQVAPRQTGPANESATAPPASAPPTFRALSGPTSRCRWREPEDGGREALRAHHRLSPFSDARCSAGPRVP